MIDTTLILVFGFSVIRIFLWGIVVVYTIAVLRKIYRDLNPKGDGAEISPVKVFLDINRWLIIRWVIVLLLVFFYSTQEFAYRPKVTVDRPNHALSEQLREIDMFLTPEIKSRSSLGGVDKGAFEENDKSNREAQKRFMEIPE
ncbi:hypothetical protein ACFLY7_01960 [Patescibacteria group bacterium]